MRNSFIYLLVVFSGMFSIPLAQGLMCESGILECNGYQFQNNVWYPTGNWAECVQTFCDTGNSWAVDWTFESPTWVQSYPNVTVTDAENAGLPWQVQSNRPTYATWVIDTIGGNTVGYHAYTAAFDIWTTTAPRFANSPPKMELMIWLYRSGAVGSAGGVRETISLEGHTWTVYVGTMSTWKYIAFLSTTNLKRVDALNLSTFINYAAKIGHAAATDYVTCVSAGHEIGGGTGYAKTSKFKVWWGQSTSAIQPMGIRPVLHSSKQVHAQTNPYGSLNEAADINRRPNIVRYNINGSKLKGNQYGHASGVYLVKNSSHK